MKKIKVALRDTSAYEFEMEVPDDFEYDWEEVVDYFCDQSEDWRMEKLVEGSFDVDKIDDVDVASEAQQ